MLAGNGAAAGDAARLVIVACCGLGGRCHGLDNSDRLDHGDRGWDRLRCNHRLDDGGRLDGRHDGLGLRLHLDGCRCGLFRHRLLHRFVGLDCRLGGGRGGLGSCRLLRGALLDRLDFFRLLVTGQTITNCATF
jgi:hypothetical protein